MTRLQFEVRSPRTPEQVFDALVDFSPERPRLWPAIDPEVYRVHAVGDTWADVTEGSDVMGGIWACERYDWSMPGLVKATVAESNFWHAGGTWQAEVDPAPDGGSVVRVTRDRTARTPRARVLEAMLKVAGRRLLAGDLAKAPALSGNAATTPPSASTLRFSSDS